jgi:hypothetical protein
MIARVEIHRYAQDSRSTKGKRTEPMRCSLLLEDWVLILPHAPLSVLRRWLRTGFSVLVVGSKAPTKRFHNKVSNPVVGSKRYTAWVAFIPIMLQQRSTESDPAPSGLGRTAGRCPARTSVPLERCSSRHGTPAGRVSPKTAAPGPFHGLRGRRFPLSATAPLGACMDTSELDTTVITR